MINDGFDDEKLGPFGEHADEDPDEDGEGRGDGKDKKTYSFVSLPGNAVKKRPRRRYDEIERLYQCKCVFFFLFRPGLQRLDLHADTHAVACTVIQIVRKRTGP